MTTRVVKTQQELDAALTDAKVSSIHIDSPRDVWLHLNSSGSATVRAYGSATVRATPRVAIHLHSARAAVTGGVVIDISALDLNNPTVWTEHHGVEVVDDQAILYKATSAELIAGADYGKPTTYTVGTEVAATDWRDDHDCGGGLHISPRPDQARRYRNGEAGTRYLRVAVPLESLRPIDESKAKARQVRVLAEVDLDGVELAGAGRESGR